MSDLENLQKRATGAVQMLKRSQKERRHQNQSLGQILNDLEIKFEARTSELSHCRERIAQLESSNRALTSLLAEMIDIMERAAEDTSDDPVFRATATAKDIVERYVSQGVANDDGGVSGIVVEAVDEETTTPEEAFSGEHVKFEDVGREFLFAEAMYEREYGSENYPRLVFDAVAAARGGEAEEEAPIDIPERVAAAGPVSPQADDGMNDGDLDIKEIMARLEIAAERAQLRADADARRVTLEPAFLERAVGGRA